MCVVIVVYHLLQGRGGKGSLFTWAAGNGGDIYDTCAADGYVQSIHTIAVGGYAQSGGPAYFDEKCSAKMTVAYVENTINPEIHVVISNYMTVINTRKNSLY